MQIHVVRAGQTLWRLSRTYGIPVDAIASANELSPEQTLVIGQALVIPVAGSYYFVVRGDTLTSVAARFGTTAAKLAAVNGIAPGAVLQAGTRLYVPPAPKRKAYVNAYLDPGPSAVSAALTEAARGAAPLLTYLAPSSFRIQRDGTVKPPPLGDLRTSRRGGAPR